MHPDEKIVLSIFAIGLTPVLGPILGKLFEFSKEVIQFCLNSVVRLVLVKKEIDNGSCENAILTYLYRHKTGRMVSSNRSWYYLFRNYIKPLKEWRQIWWERKDLGARLFRYQGALILIMTSGTRGMNYARFWYIRGTVDWMKVLRESEVLHNEVLSNLNSGVKNFRVVHHSGRTSDFRKEGMVIAGFSNNNNAPSNDPPKQKPVDTYTAADPINWRQEDIGVDTSGSTLEDLSLGPKQLAVIQDVKFWISNKDWYRSRGVPWRRGYLFHGLPGTGKTSLARAVAEMLDLTVHIFHLASMSSSDFLDAWTRARAESNTRMVIFEDFDGVFGVDDDLRANRNEGGLTFDILLNTLDGIEREDGLILVITTNHIKRVDPAIGIPDATGASTRPGRIDRVVEFDNLDYIGRYKLANRIIRDDILARELASTSERLSPAQIQEAAIQVALQQLWAERAA